MLEVDGTSNRLAFYFHNGHSYFSSLPLSAGWHHVAVSKTFGTSNTTVMYVDGVPVGSFTEGTPETTAPTVNNEPLWIGNSIAPDGFAGYIDDVRIYQANLSSQNISDIYNYTRKKCQ